MITGTLLLNPKKEITYEQCIKKYAFRMFLVLLIFGYPFAIIKLVGETKTFDISYLYKGLFNLLVVNTLSHLWYVYSLIGIYLILPILKAFINKVAKKDLEYFLFIIFVFDFVIPFINNILNISIAFGIPFSFSIFWIVLGHYLNSYEINIRNLYKVLIVIACTVLFGCLEYSDYNNVISSMYDNPIVVIQASTIFLLFKSIKQTKFNSDKLWKIDRLCFCVYLIHPLFIQTMYRFLKITPIKFGMIYHLMTFVFFLIYTVVSFMASKILYLIKPLKEHIL